jgi:lysophospholipase L1-like esterase
MAQLCRDRDIELIILLPPLHKTYRDQTLNWINGLNKKLLQNLREVKKVRVLDFSAHSAFEDACFFDEFHLNHRGAIQMSKLIHQEVFSNAKP